MKPARGQYWGGTGVNWGTSITWGKTSGGELTKRRKCPITKIHTSDVVDVNRTGKWFGLTYSILDNDVSYHLTPTLFAVDVVTLQDYHLGMNFDGV